MDKKERYLVSGRVVLRRIGEDVLLVPVSGPAATGGGRVYPLNETARTIWERLVAGCTIPLIVDEFVSAYDVSRDQAQMDVDACVETFLSEGLLEGAEA